MNRKVATIVDSLIVVAILAVLVALLIPAIKQANASIKYKHFKNSFGEIKKEGLENLNEKSCSIIQDWVDKKMAELAREYLDAKNGVSWEEAVADPSNLEEVNVALIQLTEGKTREKDALNKFLKARDAANAYKFQVKENPEDYVEK